MLIPTDEVKPILLDAWGPHYREVEEDVDRVLDGLKMDKSAEDLIHGAEGGESYDRVEAIKVVYYGAKIVAVLFGIYFAWLKATGKKPSDKELSVELEKRVEMRRLPKAVVEKTAYVIKLVRKTAPRAE